MKFYYYFSYSGDDLLIKDNLFIYENNINLLFINSIQLNRNI